MTLRLITAPATEPVTLAEVKSTARVDDGEFDTSITSLIVMAREFAENETQRALITQTWEKLLDKFPEGDIKLGRPPVQSITSVKYYDTDGTLQTLSSSLYTLDADTLPGYVRLNYSESWPSTRDIPNAVIVRFEAGYGAAADVPQNIKNWIALRAATMVDVTSALGNATEFPRSYIDGMLDAYRVYL